MNYVSTRGGAPPIGFTDALIGGLAPDGGLYSPALWPKIAPEEIAAFAGRPYAEVAADILARFVGETIGRPDLEATCEDAYAHFDHVAVTPLVQIASGRFLLELFHGPSLAFKDIALRLLAGLYQRVLSSHGGRLTLLCATSGDTGGAAAAAFAGAERLRCVVLFPEGRISEGQRRFITATGAENVAALAIAGDFDDCQALVKAMLADRAFAAEARLVAVNSINIARVLAQSVYYFVAAAALGAPTRPVRFVVPTGNLGDGFAGWAAHAMGLPVAGIRLATNANDGLVGALRDGVWRRAPTITTTSPAMDIQAPSNFERLLFECANRDAAAVGQICGRFAATGEAAIAPPIVTRMSRLIEARSIKDAAAAVAMTTVWRQTGRLVDPHTAVALAAAEPDRGSAAATVILATAHPAKFPDSVATATSQRPAPPAALARLADRPERIHRLALDIDAVRAVVAGLARS